MANTNAWFKHYNDASEGGSMELLWAKQDYETIAFFWRLNEFMSKFESETDRGTCTISLSLLKRKLGWNRSRSLRVLGKINSSFEMKTELQSDGETVKVFTPNWLKLQENRGGKRESKKEQKPDRREKRDIRSKNKETEIEIQAIVDHWNSQKWDLPKVSEVTKARKSKIKTRLSEAPLEAWLTAINLIHESPFLLGKVKDWKADFDWLIANETNRAKIAEGKYKAVQIVQNEKMDWQKEAEIIMQACKRYGFSSEAIQPHVGIERIKLLRAAGGASKLGAEPDTPFTIKNLANKLKAAFEISQQKVS